MRLIAFGDSLLLPRHDNGDVVRWADLWPKRLGGLLATRYPDVEVINCGARRRTVASNGMMRRFCASNNHKFIDFEADLSRSAACFCSDGYHLSSEGHERVAYRLLDEIQPRRDRTGQESFAKVSVS